MPELPEVETLKRILFRKIVGKTIADFWSDWPKKVEPRPQTLRKKIVGKKIIGISRRAKVLLFDLSDGYSIAIHLKLTGQLIYKHTASNSKLVYGGHPQPGGLDNLPNKYTHHYLTFSDGSTLFFNDLRKFGWVKLVSKSEVEKLSGEFGIEPGDERFTLDHFIEQLQRYSNRPIKQVLLDQSLIAGLGNIYVDESLFAAGILPTRKSGKLSTPEQKKLWSSIKKVIAKAITYQGTSTESTYSNDVKSLGGYVKFLKVYGRAALPCKRCKTLITKIQLGGRGTHYCPNCQR